MKYGIIVPQGWRMDLVGTPDPMRAYETMLQTGIMAEKLGFDALWVFDHFHTVPVPSQEVTFECWTTTTALAAHTKKIRIGQIVTCNSYRNPALLAKMASTVDVISNGRLNFGIGAGWYEQEYRAYGYPFPDAPTRLKQLKEAVQIILQMWTKEEATFTGTYYSVNGAINQPKGLQKPHIPLLIGGGGEKVTLKIVAQYADACNIGSLSPEDMKRKFTILKNHCTTVGRKYEHIRKTILMNCSLDKNETVALERAKKSYFSRNARGEEHILTRSLVGTPDQVKKRLSEYEKIGVDEVILYFPQDKRMESISLFAEQILHK